MTGMPAATAFLTGADRAAASGIGNDEAVGLGSGDGVDHLGHLRHVEGFGRQIFGLDAQRLGGVVHAVLDHRPIGIAALAVGDEDHAGFVGRGDLRGRRQQREPGNSAEHRPHDFLKREHVSSCFMSLPASRGGQTSCHFLSFVQSSALVALGAEGPIQFMTANPASVASRDRFLKPIVA